MKVPYDDELEEVKPIEANTDYFNITIKEEPEDLEQTILHNKSKLLPAIDRTKEGPDETTVMNNIKDIKELNEIENIKLKYVEMLYIMNQI